MGGTAVPVGPFRHGLNISRPARLIRDDELSSCVNFDIGQEGELSLRPGVRSVMGVPAWLAGTLEILGIAKIPGMADQIYMQGLNNGTGFYEISWCSDIHAPAWSNVVTYAAGDKAGDAVQYNNKLWIPGSGPTAVGRSIDVTTHTVATVAAMPKGVKSFIYKDRLFLFDTNTYRVYYSAATDPTSWPGANFFDINPGDGEPIISAVVSGESVIFMKQNSSWILYYDSDPGLGTLRKLNTDIGVTGENAVAITTNDVYTVGTRGVYRLTNNYFESISDNLRLYNVRSGVASDATKDFISVLVDKLIIRVKSATVYRYFVYSLENGSWTEYTFPTTLGKFYRYRDADNVDHFLAADELGSNLYALTPYGDNPLADTPVGSFATKFFDYGDSAGWKRLFWFSAEVKTNGGFTLSVKSDESAKVDTVEPTPSANVYGTFKAFLSRRFRTVQYSLVTSGSSFTFVSAQVMVDAKKKVVDAVTV